MSRDPMPERADASLRVIAVTASALAFGVALSLGVGHFLLLRAPGLSREGSLGPQGRFQNGDQARTGIQQDWAVIDRETRERLETYGWVNRRAGVVRIPIERAMERLAAEPRAPQ